MKEILITSSVLILLITAVRFIFRDRISRRLQYALWGLVLLRLLLPFSLPASPVSVLSAAEALETRWQEYTAPTANITLPATELPSAAADDAPSAPMAEQKPGPTAMLRSIWLCGAILIGLWFLAVNLQLMHRLKKSRSRLEIASPLPVYLTDAIVSPCLFGLFRPAVYLTSKATVTDDVQRHVLTHELCHWKHKDHWFSALRCLCLAVYWFDPLVWLAAFFSKADGELACDESAIRALGSEQRLAYGRTLVDMIAPGREASGVFCAATTMVSGSKSIRRRLQRIVSSKKTLLWAAICALLIALLGAGCAFTAPQTPTPELPDVPPVSQPDTVPEHDLDAAVRAAILDGLRVDDGQFPTESHVILKAEAREGDTAAYLLAHYMVFSCRGGTLLQDGVGGQTPMVLTFSLTEEGYALKERWEPLGGEGYAAEIREKFPDDIEDAALDPSAYGLAFHQDVYRQANRHFGIDPTDQVAKALWQIAKDTQEAGTYNYRTLDHRAVLYNGDRSVRYILSEFLKEEQNGVYGEILWKYLCAIYPGDVEPFESPFVSYQHSFDEWKDYVVLLAERNGAGFFANNRTATNLLTLLGKHTPQEALTVSRTVTGGDHGVARDGDLLTYEISVTNNTSADMKGIPVTAQDVTHTSISTVDGTPVSGWVAPVWSLDIPAGQTKTVQYAVKVGGKPGDKIYADACTAAGQTLPTLTTHIVAGEHSTLADIAAAPPAGDASIGVSVSLIYADKAKVVFYGYFGVYVYDLAKEAIVMGIDLEKAVGTTAIQGSDPAAADVSSDGKTLRLYRLSDVAKKRSILWIDLTDGTVRFAPWNNIEIYGATLSLQGGSISALTYEYAGKKHYLFQK